MSAKITKNKSYFSRFQTPFRRRREAKTEYVQRSGLIQQDRTKYGARKYRLVARITNTKIIAQVVAADLEHDITIAQATSQELTRYGITLGLTNYAAAYAVGLLLARRLLTQLGLDKVFAKPIAGKIDDDEDEDARRPFRVILDVGLRRTTTGARVFAVMKGAADGGLFIPHNDDRLAGSTTGRSQSKKRARDDDDTVTKSRTVVKKPAAKPAGKGGAKGAAKPAAKAPAKAAAKPAATKSSGGAKEAADKPAKEKAGKAGEAGTLRYYILGGHVAAYMTKLQAEKPEAYQRQFGKYIKAGIGPEQLQGIYENAHKQIRANPAPAPKATEHYKPKTEQTKKTPADVRRAALNERLAAAGLAPR